MAVDFLANPDLLAQVFRFLTVDCQAECACVNATWYEGVAIARTTIELDHLRTSRASSLGWYLESNPSHVQALVLRRQSSSTRAANTRLQLSLPWSSLTKLQVLVIAGMDLNRLTSASGLWLGGGGQWLVGRPLLPELRQLELDDCRLSPSCLMQLAASKQLTSFKFGGSDCGAFLPTLSSGLPRTSAQTSREAGVFSQLLQLLQQLIKLQISGFHVNVTAFQHIASMENLQDLDLFVDLEEDCAALPSSITRLLLAPHKTYQEVPMLSTTVLQQLSSMQRLELESFSVSGTALGTSQQLQQLRLLSCKPSVEAFNCVPQQLQVLRLSNCEHPKGEDLLSAIGQLTCLQSLDLVSTPLHGVKTPQHFSALTASAQLTRLHVRQLCIELPLLPGAVQHMINADRGQRLQNLSISLSTCQHSFIDNQDLAVITSCCPSLHTLQLSCTICPGADMSHLKQLTACRELAIGGQAVTDNAAAAVLAQLQQLEVLDLYNCPALTDVGLEVLTALTRLTSLSARSCPGLSKAVRKGPPGYIGKRHSPSNGDLELSSGDAHADDDEPQDPIYVQLFVRCSRSPACAKKHLYALQWLQAENEYMKQLLL